MLNYNALNYVAHSLQSRPLRAATLLRVSTAEQAADGRSGISRQKESNAAAVASHGFEVVASFEIIDVSGTNAFSSNEMLQLIALVESGQVDILVVSEMSRIFRPDDLASFASLDVFKRNQVKLCCGGTIHDLATAEGFLQSGLMSLLSGYDRKLLIRRMLESKESKRSTGLCPSAKITLPTGLQFSRESNTFSYNSEIWKIKEAFRLIDEEGHRNISEIARRVSIHHRTLKNLLSNTYVIGIRSYTHIRDQNRKSTKPGGKQGDRPKLLRKEPLRVRIIPPEEQAVSDERFNRVQKFLAEAAERHAKVVAPHKGTNLLAGSGFCGCCGQRIYTVSTSYRKPNGSKGRGYYICRSKSYSFKGKIPTCSQGWLQRDTMDELVGAFILQFLQDPDFLNAILVHAQSKQRGVIVGIDSAPASIRQQISDLEKRDKRLLDAIESGAIALSEVKTRRQRLADEKRALLSTLEEMDGRETASSLPRGIIGRLATMGAEAWTSLTCAREKKKLLSTIFMEVYVRGESITAFKFAPSLVGADSGEYSWISDIPVTLPEPFRIRPLVEKAVIPSGYRRCSRCNDVLESASFHGSRAGCKACIRADNNARYKAKAAAAKAGRAALG